MVRAGAYSKEHLGILIFQNEIIAGTPAARPIHDQGGQDAPRPPITLRQLLFFDQVVRHQLNVTAAAEALYTAQSGVSKQLRALADELGVELFRREGNRLVGLTEAGQRIHTLAERMLRDAETIRGIGRGARQDDKSRLRVVATRHAASTRVRNAVLEFQRQQPKIALHVSEEDPDVACRMTLSGEAQLGVVPESHAIDKQLQAIPLERWLLAVVVPAGHWLLAESEITLEMLAECPVGCYEHGAASRQQVDAAFEQAGLISPVVFELVSSDKILEYVESGACIGIVAESAFASEQRPALRRLEAGHLFPALTTSIIVRRSGAPSLPASDFIALLRLDTELGPAEQTRLTAVLA